MNKVKPLFRIPIKYGASASVLAIVLMIVMFYAGKHPLLIPIFFDYRIFLFGVIIFFSIKEYRDYYNGGKLHFWEGILNGVTAYVVVALIVGVFIVVFSYIDPGFLNNYIEGTIQGLMLDKDQLVYSGSVTISEEEFERQVNMLRELRPSVLVVDYFVKSLIIGFPLTLIMAVFLRKTEKRFGNRSTAE